LRAAGGGAAIVTPLDPWRHDLSATDRFTELWPFLLVLALLLWPLDIGLRRMSLGRRELAAARAWVTGIGRRRSATARRTATSESLFVARERAGSNEARAAILGSKDVGTSSTAAAEPEASEADAAAAQPAPASSARAARRSSQSPQRPSPPASPQPLPPPTPSPGPGQAATPPDTIGRLQDAKRRARER
jgi:hypothetical protein